MTPNPIRVAAATSLADINTIIAQTEAIVGPLVQMGNDAVETVLTFDSDPPAPMKNAVIATDVAGQPNIPAAAAKVCSGVIFVAGVKTASTAARLP